MEQAGLLQGLAEIDLRGGRDAVGPLAEEHLVDEQGENLFLREFLLDLVGEERFTELARK